MDTLRLCQKCRTPLAINAVGPFCPKCQQTPTGIAFQNTAGAPTTSPAVPGVAQIAEFFPQLEILELIGHGGMGMVYKARQVNLDRMVALKILSPELSSQPAFAERFSREAKAMARLHHSNIVAIYDFGRAGPYYYFLMEYVDGVDLHTLIHQKEIKPPQALRIIIEVCHALQFAHDEGIIHRDIKPANILLDKKGRVKMADFGLSKLIATDGKPQSALTQTTGVLGTPQYMAPEQVEKPSEVDHRADLYSLGVIFYEMLTGELPLGRFPPPSEKTHTDARLDKIVMRALEKEPKLRYQQASEILTQVETIAAPAGTAARSRKIALLRQIAIAAATALLAVGAYAVFHPKSTTAGPNGPGRPLSFTTNTPDGIAVNQRAITELHLTPQQTQSVNSIIRSIERDVRDAEHKHATRTTNDLGHFQVVIKPFEDEAKQLSDRMWAEMGGVLAPDQIAIARKIQFGRALIPVAANQTINIEFWKDDAGEYHFTDTRDSRRGESSTLNSGTNFNQIVPRQYRSFWPEAQNTPAAVY